MSWVLGVDPPGPVTPAAAITFLICSDAALLLRRPPVAPGNRYASGASPARDAMYPERCSDIVFDNGSTRVRLCFALRTVIAPTSRSTSAILRESASPRRSPQHQSSLIRLA